METIKISNFKLGIGLPLSDTNVPMQFFTTFLVMEKPHPSNMYLPTFPVTNRSIDAVRNDLVQQAINENCTHLAMLDTDQIYPMDTLTKLLSHNVDVCGSVVHRRWSPFDPVLYRGVPGYYTHVSDEEMFSGKLIEVDATGTGCILFSMECFKKVEPPWFKIDLTSTGKIVGEDIHFCYELRKRGVRIFVDTSIEIEHMTTYIVNRGTYLLYKNLHPYEWRPGKD